MRCGPGLVPEALMGESRPQQMLSEYILYTVFTFFIYELQFTASACVCVCVCVCVRV